MQRGKPLEIELADAVAVIDEARCIGCTLCIQACPVDAIVGAARLMHTIISAACTGCELCLAPCPVDCISMRPESRGEDRETVAAAARRRCTARNLRLSRAAQDKAARLAARHAAAAETRKKETIARALERARARLRGRRS